MNKPGMFRSLMRWPLRLPALALVGALLLPGAFVADRAALAQAQQVYQQERAACLAGRTGQERESCLREAAAALKEATSVQPAADPAQLERNRLRRCDDLAAQAREACQRMMRGEGEQGGSVEGGVVVRRIVTVIPPAGAASAPSR
jgi:hypothetical protein